MNYRQITFILIASAFAVLSCQRTASAQLPAQFQGRDLLDTTSHRLIDYRRLFRYGVTPQPHEMVGYWRGVNKGIVELVGYRQFIKEIQPQDCAIFGDNIKVGQVDNDILRCFGWQPNVDPMTGGYEREGKFRVESPRGFGLFSKGVVFSYRNGGNRRNDPARLLVDKVVKIDENHMLGRVTANFGPIHIPLAYFVLERM